MLDRLDAGEAELVGARGEAQALLVIFRGGAVLRPERGKEVNSESHGVRSSVTKLSSRRPPSSSAPSRQPGPAPTRPLYRTAPSLISSCQIERAGNPLERRRGRHPAPVSLSRRPHGER